MLGFYICMVLIMFLDLFEMVKTKQNNKTFIVYFSLMGVAIAISVYYYSNPYRESIAKQIMNIIGDNK